MMSLVSDGSDRAPTATVDDMLTSLNLTSVVATGTPRLRRPDRTLWHGYSGVGLGNRACLSAVQAELPPQHFERTSSDALSLCQARPAATPPHPRGAMMLAAYEGTAWMRTCRSAAGCAGAELRCLGPW